MHSTSPKGNSNISQHDKNHEKLGKWIKNQRYEYKKYNNPDLGPSRLSRDRIEKLNECGFQWRLRPDRVPWEDRYKALVHYKAVNGHTNVELGHELRKWVQYQRSQRLHKIKWINLWLLDLNSCQGRNNRVAAATQ